jgi:hypothetical protein
MNECENNPFGLGLRKKNKSGKEKRFEKEIGDSRRYSD